MGGGETVEPVCVGSTTPKKDLEALFQITCGESTYIGSDPYYFARDDWSDPVPKQPFICKDDASVRGTWKLLGFFPEGSCSSIETGHVFDEFICSKEDAAIQ